MAEYNRQFANMRPNGPEATFGCFPRVTSRRLSGKNGHPYSLHLHGLARRSIRTGPSTEKPSITRCLGFETALAEKSLSESGRSLANLLNMKSHEEKPGVLLKGINVLIERLGCLMRHVVDNMRVGYEEGGFAPDSDPDAIYVLRAMAKLIRRWVTYLYLYFF